MTKTLFVATIACVVANAFIACADYLGAAFVVKNSAEVNVPVGALPWLATLKLAGAMGLLAGFVVAPWLGIAAGVGLTLFFVGAVSAHLRARVLYNIAFPGAYLVLALAATAYMVHLTENDVHRREPPC